MIETIFGTCDRLMEAAGKIKTLRLEKAALFRACFLETDGSLELLKLLSKDASEGAELRDGLEPGALLRFLSRLEVSVSLSILLDPQAAGPGCPLSEGFRGDFSVFLMKTAFVTGRVEALKRLEALDSGEAELLHGIDLKRRIENLSAGLLELYRILKEQDGVREIFVD